MGTRESTRTRLLDATDELLLASGDPATPVDRILERAGVSPATLYRAYPSKEALVAAALDRRHAEWQAVWDDAVARAGSERDRLLAVFDALEHFRARATGARWCAFLGTAAAYADPPPVLATAVAQESESLHTRLRTLAEPVAGDRADELAEAVALVFTGALGMRLRPGRAVATADARAVAAVLVDAAAAWDSAAARGTGALGDVPA
ncbi:TetR/AcrR family transcriptional regulator [Nocardioides abyssi]|uniref:TetR/AcrR family transcriptional regulator n=1 Tax=Nocardioides abyssi TaxID=3058370 RepID=A0ABT8EQL6_9ACTN|nr:TetR/AcrR family transcriptional regulator [Nocardioides abyssi]MDN4160429.1 TetR/AcrR family transcriptional regulator [Nocardioides abyssi]